MTAVGGSIQELALDGRTFAVAADADVETGLGGWQNEVQLNGDGSPRLIKLRVGWTLGGITVSINDMQGDLEFLQELRNRKTMFPVDITRASGCIQSGVGQIIDDVNSQSMNATAEISLSGGGTLAKQ